MAKEISLVVAMNQNNIIGKNNQLPWHIPEDLKHFKQVTMGKPIIMGRKTFESIGKVLPGRENIVISRSENLNIAGVSVVSSLKQAISVNYPEVCIIGGGEIFKLAMPYATKLYLTIIDLELSMQGAILFPQIKFNNWELINSKEIITAKNLNCKFLIYTRN